MMNSYKLRLFPCLLWFILGVFSCATSTFSTDRNYRIPEDFIGISPDRSPLEKADYEQLDEFGVHWTRRTIRWTDVEPEEGNWNFSGWDKYVDDAKAAGKKVLLTLGFDNRWLYKNNKEHRDLGARELPYFLAYIEKVVDRYRGKVDAFEIWNEPNGWFWYGSNRHFFELSRAAARRIRETDPEAVILAGSLFRVQERFVRGMFEAGAMENTDAISIHPYASNALGTIKQIDKLRRILEEYNYPGEIWVTEAGYPTAGLYPTGNNLKKYPEYIVKTITTLAARGIRNLIWYELMDEYNRGKAPDPWNPSNYFGLIYPDNTRKNGAAAFILCSRYLPGTEYRPEFPEKTDLPSPVTALYFHGKDDSNTLVLWNDSFGKSALRLIIPGTERLSHDISSGIAEPLPGETLISLTRTPMFITWNGDSAVRIEAVK
jgi:hypothetical protein